MSLSTNNEAHLMMNSVIILSLVENQTKSEFVRGDVAT